MQGRQPVQHISPVLWRTYKTKIMLRTTNAAGRIRDESLMNLGGREPNNLQIFYFCCIYGNEKEKSKSCCHTLFEVKRI
jgi:hypothetical protein